MTQNTAKSFNILLHNYFDGSNKIIFIDLYLAKFVNISAKPFFPCKTNIF